MSADPREAPTSPGPPGSPGPLGPLGRAAGVAAAWLALYLAGPGIVWPDGSALLAVLGVGLWARVAACPGRGAFLIEAVAALALWSGICSWAAQVHWSSLLFIGPGFGLYFAGCGVLLRRLARDWPLALAAPAAWMAVEALRTLLEPPFGLSWMRLGIHAHAVPLLAGSARVWGVWGISFALAAAAGLLADLLRLAEGRGRVAWRLALAAGAAPLLAALLLSVATAPPPMERGLRVMLVQPAIPQERKMQQRSSSELYLDGYELTERGLAEAAAAGEPPIDLLAWGESMLPLYVVASGTREALRAGAKSPPWVEGGYDERLFDDLERAEREWVLRGLLSAVPGRRGLLAPGTAFVSGVEVLLARDGTIGRQNAVALWRPDGTRVGQVGKRQLVPGAETMLGLERYEFVRSTIHAVAGYIPDLVPHEGSRRLAFTTRAGREVVLAASVCFDNAYDGAFVAPLVEGPADVHLVASNEAWFRGDQEQDQMMAFSHLAAVATGRSIVRATNSGITAVVGPDGRDVARLRVAGQDREVPGTLRAEVPLPTAEARRGSTVYVRSWRLWPVLALCGPVLLILAARRRRPGYRGQPPG